MDETTAANELVRLREAIDRVDEVLVKLLNQRAKYAIEIGELKGVLDLPIYVPDREKAVLLHVEGASRGPLADAAVRRLFERIIDESRRVERESASGIAPKVASADTTPGANPIAYVTADPAPAERAPSSAACALPSQRRTDG